MPTVLDCGGETGGDALFSSAIYRDSEDNRKEKDAGRRDSTPTRFPVKGRGGESGKQNREKFYCSWSSNCCTQSSFRKLFFKLRRRALSCGPGSLLAN